MMVMMQCKLLMEIKKEKNTNKPLEGHFKKAGVTPKKFLVEFDIVPGFDYEMGQVFNASIFKQGDSVKVTGTSKGRGFSGVMKRHGFAGGPKTHGQREHPRSAGSIGQASDPSRVFKGVKMPGQYGNKKMTVENLKVVKIDTKNNHIFVKGAVPGSNNGMVIVNK